ncbi:MAG: site-2 protease family protein, partial [Rhodomicrobium sp.]
VPHQSFYTYVVMGIVGALGLFASIILHELAHAVMARKFGLPIGGITLFIFGGVAELKQEPQTPSCEFWVALVGPVASVMIAAVCYFSSVVFRSVELPTLSGVLAFLALTNTVLALFNLAPAFPLDGGRILRSIIWWRTGNFRRATRIASMFGTMFGGLLVIAGLVQIVEGHALGGTWQLLIGIFLAAAASQSRNHVNAAENLKGVSVADLMDRSPLSVGPDLTVEALVKDFIYGLNRKFIIVAEDGKAFGYIAPEQIKRVLQSQWRDTFVRTIAERFTHDTVVSPASSAMEALRKLQSNGIRHLAVLEGNALVGTVSETNFLNYITVREEVATPAKALPAEAAPSGG